MAAIHPIDSIIKRQKWGWIGHTLRKDEQCIARQETIACYRKKNRQASGVLEEIRRNLSSKSLDKSWPEVKNMAKLRTRWRIGVIDALCPVGE